MTSLPPLCAELGQRGMRLGQAHIAPFPETERGVKRKQIVSQAQDYHIHPGHIFIDAFIHFSISFSPFFLFFLEIF